MKQVIYLLVAFSSLIFLAFSCKSQDNKRAEIAKRVVSALKKNDTVTLYSLIDTAYCNSLFSKEAFNRKLEFIQTNINNCSLPTDVDNNIKIDKQINSSDYIIGLCPFTQPNGEITKRFMVLSFSGNETEKVKLVDIRYDKMHLEDFSPPPPIKPTSSNNQ